ncbi:phytase family, partial [Trypanosoma conorhini]
CGEVVHLVRPQPRNEAVQHRPVRHVAVVEREVFVAVDVVDSARVEGRRPPDDAVHIVALLEEQLRKVRPVLPGDAGDHGDTPLGHGRHRLSTHSHTCPHAPSFPHPCNLRTRHPETHGMQKKKQKDPPTERTDENSSSDRPQHAPTHNLGGGGHRRATDASPQPPTRRHHRRSPARGSENR